MSPADVDSHHHPQKTRHDTHVINSRYLALRLSRAGDSSPPGPLQKTSSCPPQQFKLKFPWPLGQAQLGHKAKRYLPTSLSTASHESLSFRGPPRADVRVKDRGIRRDDDGDQTNVVVISSPQRTKRWQPKQDRAEQQHAKAAGIEGARRVLRRRQPKESPDRLHAQ